MFFLSEFQWDFWSGLFATDLKVKIRLCKRLDWDSSGLKQIAVWFLIYHVQFLYTEANRARAALLLWSPLMAVNKTGILSPKLTCFFFMKKNVSAMIMY